MSCGAKVESTELGCRFFWKRTTLLMTFLGSRSEYASKTRVALPPAAYPNPSRLENLLACSNTLERNYFCRLEICVGA